MRENLNHPEDDSSVNSIIGEGTTLRGDFELNGLLRIDGVFFGRVRTNGKVLIGKNGVAECEIVAGTVVVGGKVKGEIFATEKITLLSTGELIGNVKTPRLIIEEGVIFDGKCEIIEDKERLNKLKEEYFKKIEVHPPRIPGILGEAHVTSKHREAVRATQKSEDEVAHGAVKQKAT
jgi:cytoskeletal protein CcmA (bactofilin family)